MQRSIAMGSQASWSRSVEDGSWPHMRCTPASAFPGAQQVAQRLRAAALEPNPPEDEEDSYRLVSVVLRPHGKAKRQTSYCARGCFAKTLWVPAVAPRRCCLLHRQSGRCQDLHRAGKAGEFCCGLARCGFPSLPAGPSRRERPRVLPRCKTRPQRYSRWTVRYSDRSR
jgi:hypothetical protein